MAVARKDVSTGVQLEPYEKETIIRWDETNDQYVELYTASKRVADRLIKSGVKPVRTEKQGWFFILPKSSIRVKPDKKAIHIAGKHSKQ